MLTVNRNHFGFSKWTNKKLIQLIILISLSSSYIHVNGQRVTRPNVPSSLPSIPPITSSSPPPPTTSIQQTKCPYSNEEILGVIFTSVIVTIVVIGLTLIAVWFLFKKKIISFTSGGSHSIRDVNINDKTLQVDATNKQHHQPNGNLLNDEDKQYKRLIKSLPPLTSVFNHLSNQSKGPIKSLDDTFIMTKPEQVSVRMTGHDFTGLGFNICGNMRDGIFIKDVLTRGPANESGLIKAGDRIMSITVSCEKMVYEDALTILSYASPYDVTLQVEKTSKSKSTTPNGVTGNGHIYMPRRYANGLSGSSDPSNHRILHPVFRSHSVGELTTRLNSSGGSGDDKPSSLEEKSFGSIKSINSLLRKIKTSLYRSTASIKSNQSDKGKMATDYCSTIGLNDGSEGGYHHSCYSLDASGLTNGQISSSSSYILPSPTSNTNQGKSSEIAINMSPKEPMVSTIKHLSASSPGAGEILNKLSEEMIESDGDKPTIDEPTVTSGSPDELGQSRKLNQGKRKAPAPPSPSSSTCSIEMKHGPGDERDDGVMVIVRNSRNELRSTTPGGSKVETHADIHQEQGSSEDFTVLQGQSLSDISEIKSPAIDVSLSLAMESITSEDPSTTEPLAVNLVKEMKGNGRAPSPAAGKSKSCSLSDLTLVKNKKPSSTIILERAVSLDLRDQLGPEENKILQQGTMIEDNQGLLRWSETKPPVCGPDSLSTTYSSEMLGSNSKTNDFTDDSLTITVDEGSERSPTAPKPAERTSLKRNSLSNSTDSRLRSSSKFEGIDMIISEEENIVAPPDGFGSDNHHHHQQQPEMVVSSKPSIEDVKLKSDLNSGTEGSDESTPKVTKFTTINGLSKSVQSNDKLSSNTQKTKPSISEKPPALSSKFDRLSPSQERLDSTLFDVPTKIEISSSMNDDLINGNKMNGTKSEKDHNLHRRVSSSSSSSSTIGNRYPIEPEVIEISPNELSQVMMSHEEFLTHKSKLSYGKTPKVTSSSNLINKSGMNGIGVSGGHAIVSKVPPATIIQIGETGDNDFESWSYLSDIESNLPSLSNETRYKTTCDMGQLNDGSDEILVKKI